MKLLCLDGNSIINRAFYGIKLLTTKDGRYTNAVYGFMNIFLKLLADYQPERVAVAFDMRAKTFRHIMYDKYKANRKGMPDELAEQLPVLKNLLAALGYAIVECEGYEADDILGTFAAACDRKGDSCLIATGDRDSLQLISDCTTVLLTTTHFGRGELSVMDAAAVNEKYGVEPAQLIDVKALMGDASDNIPGVAGIGEKTALELIKRFGSLDAVYQNIDSADIKDGARNKLLSGRETAYLSRKLAEICRQAPVSTELSDYKRSDGDPISAAGILQSLEMDSIISRLQLEKARPAVAAATAESVCLSEFTGVADGRVYIDLSQKEIFGCSGGRVFALSEQQAVALARDKSVKKYCFDYKRLARLCCGGEQPQGIVFDARLAAYLLNPLASGYEIEQLSAAYHAQPVIECREAAGVAALPQLCEKLSERLEIENMTSLLGDIELPLAGVLSRMEDRGFLVDVEGIKKFGKMLDLKIANMTEAIYAEVGHDFNINSPMQLAKALEDVGVPLKKRTKSGFSTDAETLGALRGTSPVIDDVLGYRTFNKLKSTYVTGLISAAGHDCRIHTEFNQTETRTGRISSLNPNLQNIPVRTELGSNLRRYFIAKPGYILLDADYSQIELRVLAHMSADRQMIADFNSGNDIHTETASRVFGVPRESVTPLMRRHAKAVNFGIVYGIGAYSLSNDIGTSVAEAAKYIDDYLSTYSGVRDYLEATVEAARRDGYVTTMYGRRRRIPELANSNKTVQALGKRLAMNTPVQGTAADIIKIAMIKTERIFEDEGIEGRLILQVHDELIAEVSEADADRAAALLKRTMEGAAQLLVPLLTDVGRGNSWYDAKL